jgi:hypothetical protein
MELLFGSHVREHGNRVGRLAAAELEPSTRRIRRLTFTADGELGPNALTCSVSAISLVHDDGEIELVPYSDTATASAMPAVPDVAVLNRSTRLKSNGREIGRLVGFEVDPAERAITTIFGRRHWWSRRLSFPETAVDYSTPGEIRVASSTTQAA